MLTRLGRGLKRIIGEAVSKYIWSLLGEEIIGDFEDILSTKSQK